MCTVTLLTDFGMKDGNVGVMKGIIKKIAPQAQVIDLSHLISPQNIAEAGLVLARSAPYFPDGTIHIVVVDPGVGTARRPIAARLGNQYFIGPDNGVVTQWLELIDSQALETRFIHLDQPQYWLPQVSHVFHGRDIFAPCGAHLAAGVALDDLGRHIHDPVRLDLPKPKRTRNGWLGQVIHIDHFGNIATNVQVEHCADKQVKAVRLPGRRIDCFVNTFGERTPGETIALFGSTGNLIISIVNGNAAAVLDVKIGEIVEVIMNQ